MSAFAQQHKSAVQLVLILPGCLGGIHGLVSLPQQGVGVFRVIGEQAHPDAGPDGELLVVKLDRLRDRFQQSIQCQPVFVGLLQAQQQNHELIAAEASDGIAAPDGIADTPRYLDQHPVASLVPHAVVDGFEAVQIEIAHGHPFLVAAGLHNCLLHAVGEQYSVGQAGQRIVMGDMLELLLVLLDVGNVAGNSQVVADFTQVVPDFGNGKQRCVDLPGFGTVPQFSAPVPLVFDGLPHALIKIGALVSRLEEARIPAEYFIAAIAGVAGKSGIGIDDGDSGFFCS